MHSKANDMKNSDNKLIIIGTGPFAQIARDYFDRFSDYQVLGFACHREYKDSDSVYDMPLSAIEDLSEIHSPKEVSVFVAVGYAKMNKMRQKVYEEIKEKGYKCPNFIHPNVSICETAELGDNIFIFEDNTIQPYTSIGNDTILWSGNHLGHHSTVGNHCFISSHVVISGSCKIGNNVFIGVNATFHDSLSIGDESLIGAGALITKNTKPKAVYLNSPTKSFPKDSEQLGF
jgi:sugar O-acyltransferase (sialic acid O-acetyltransferase NeuD family)